MIKNNFAKLLAEKGYDCRDVVRMTGLDNHVVRKIYRAQTTRIDFNTLDKLCFTLECNTGDIFKYIKE